MQSSADGHRTNKRVCAYVYIYMYSRIQGLGLHRYIYIYIIGQYSLKTKT